jgi:hypothetical protein
MKTLVQAPQTRRQERDPAPRKEVDVDTVLEFLKEPGTNGGGERALNLGSITIDLRLWEGEVRTGRVEALAPMDLLAEVRQPVPLGQLTPLRLVSELCELEVETLGLVHWQRSHGARTQVGLFLREALPDALLTRHWTDMRQELRYQASGTLWARFGSERERWRVSLVEYSRSGARLSTPHKPQINDKVELFDDEMIAAGVVRYVHPVPVDGHFQVGCEFANNAGIRLARLCTDRTAVPAEPYRTAITWKRDLPRDRRA